ncbi:MAG: hypothetical protein FWG53_09390 [Clostridiales bacterium]|nr:hypothetical protein [Clostridiales bacterium]
MANVLNVTPPATGQENVNRIRPQTAGEPLSQVHQVVDPTRVIKAQDQTVYQDRQANQYPLNMDSNFDKFLAALKDTPTLSQTYTELFFSKMGNLVNSGIGENFTREISKFMELIKMDETQLLEMLQGQQGQNLKFSGQFFDALRELVNSNVPYDLKVAVLDFLRKYDSLTSSGHIHRNIVANLRNIASALPAQAAGKLTEMIEKLSSRDMMGNNPQNLTVLKNEVMPFLAKYVAMTKDLGAVRNLIAVLTLNIARYEAGTKESYMQALRELASYSELSKAMKGAGVDEMALRLARAGQNEGNSLVDKLITIIMKGMSGDAGLQSKAVFQNMVSSILINESVYMPLLHFMLPANVNGGMFFSELWVDPNAEKTAEGEEDGRAVKLLVKFDIRDVGFFETVILAQDKKVDMELYYPEKYKDREIEMKDAMVGIMAKSGMTFRSLFLAKVDTPKSISEVFPKIYERRNAVNVIV